MALIITCACTHLLLAPVRGARRFCGGARGAARHGAQLGRRPRGYVIFVVVYGDIQRWVPTCSDTSSCCYRAEFRGVERGRGCENCGGRSGSSSSGQQQQWWRSWADDGSGRAGTCRGGHHGVLFAQVTTWFSNSEAGARKVVKQ